MPVRFESGLGATLQAMSPSGYCDLPPAAYDWVGLIVSRNDSAVLLSEFGKKRVKVGDVILLGASTLCGGEPERCIEVTTSFADMD
jgi:hypothetical protein